MVKKQTDGGHVVGIDLGTTNSVAAVYDSQGNARILLDAAGEPLTPSVVNLSDERNPVVGRAAVSQAAFAPEYTASLFKRWMGKVDANGASIPAFVHPDSGRPYAPEELSSFIIRFLVSGVEAATGRPVTAVVISVPAYFDSPAREATRRAGDLAGVKVLQIVNEPTAGGLAFGLDGGTPGTYVAYDLGGGTFDITILKIGANHIEVLATDGDRDLGGSDIDNLLIERAVAAFLAEYGLVISAETDLIAFREILEKAEAAKKTLSQSEVASFVVSSQGQRLQLDITRREFEELITPLVDKTMQISRRAVEAAKVNIDQIAGVLLVGGSTRIPLVRATLASMFGQPPRTDTKPDEAVALGAAIYAAKLAGDAGLAVVDTHGQQVLPPPVTVEEVTSHSLGCLAERDGMQRNCVIIPANTRLPAECKDVFGTVDDRQTAVRVTITSGPDGAAPDACVVHGELVLEGLPPRPAGQPTIEVKYGYTVEGRLTVTITDLISGKSSSDVRRITPK